MASIALPQPDAPELGPDELRFEVVRSAEGDVLCAGAMAVGHVGAAAAAAAARVERSAST
ncbi:hypothetical protein [Conexibacter sp. SYSU D00693]|uniref:hypothetical protein n=1 Tax=Conexibacter sp. SYSU D00693 TaxID=2812560 RepID=UPI00196B19E7|nr:hypothetical protein [Conexibacter sp. SYSU D00693]